MELNLAGKTAIVTGGASNIGKEVVLSFAREGANVVLADIDMSQAERVVAEAAGLPGKVVPVRCDVTRRDDAAVAMAAAAGFGGADILVNNVGWAEHMLFVDKDWAVAEREMAINFWGTLYITKAALPDMVERRHGRVVCVASDAGKTGEYRESIYSGAKAGVMGFVRTLAKEVGRHGITVNGVCPSMTLPETPADVGAHSMHNERDHSPEIMEKVLKRYPMRRVGRPLDVANLILFLASDAGSFITGQNISVNGGYTM